MLPWIKQCCQSGAAAVQFPCQCSPRKMAEGKGRMGHQQCHLCGHSREKPCSYEERKRNQGGKGCGGGSKPSLYQDSKAVTPGAAVHRHHKYWEQRMSCKDLAGLVPRLPAVFACVEAAMRCLHQLPQGSVQKLISKCKVMYQECPTIGKKSTSKAAAGNSLSKGQVPPKHQPHRCTSNHQMAGFAY